MKGSACESSGGAINSEKTLAASIAINHRA